MKQGPVLDRVASLIDKSLLQQTEQEGDEPRLRDAGDDPRVWTGAPPVGRWRPLGTLMLRTTWR